MPHPQKIRSFACIVSRSPLRSRRSRSLSRSSDRNRSRIRDSANASNTGNILFVGGLSKRVTSEDLIRHFTSPGMPGKALECEVVRHPQSKESRGFTFVTMETIGDADFCVRYLNQTDLFGRLMTVEKAERSRRRSPTRGRYESLKNNRGHDSRQSRITHPVDGIRMILTPVEDDHEPGLHMEEGITHPVDGIRMILTPAEDDHEPGLHMEEGIIHPVHGMRRLILTHAEDDHDPGLHMEEEITRPAEDDQDPGLRIEEEITCPMDVIRRMILTPTEDDQDPGLHMEEEINFWHPRKEKIDLGCDLLCEKYLH